MVTAFKDVERLYNQNKKDINRLEKLNTFLKEFKDSINQIEKRLAKHPSNPGQVFLAIYDDISKNLG